MGRFPFPSVKYHRLSSSYLAAASRLGQVVPDLGQPGVGHRHFLCVFGVCVVVVWGWGMRGERTAVGCAPALVSRKKGRKQDKLNRLASTSRPILLLVVCPALVFVFSVGAVSRSQCYINTKHLFLCECAPHRYTHDRHMLRTCHLPPTHPGPRDKPSI